MIVRDPHRPKQCPKCGCRLITMSGWSNGNVIYKKIYQCIDCDWTKKWDSVRQKLLISMIKSIFNENTVAQNLQKVR
jgi:hypothetical protein